MMSRVSKLSRSGGARQETVMGGLTATAATNGTRTHHAVMDNENVYTLINLR